MELILYSNFSKRKNSTKQPTGGTTVNVYLKDGCSMEKPIFLIDGVNLTYNYCRFADAYYFIDEMILSKNNIYELHCSIDVLATWKSYIGAYNTFIERASSEYDLTLHDSCISSRQEIVEERSQTVTPTMFSTTGCFIFPCMNKYGLQIFATKTMDPFAPLFYPSTYGLTDFSSWLAAGIASIGDFVQYFGKVMWIPYDLDSIVSPNKTRYISVGPLAWDLGVGNEIWVLDPDTVIRSSGVQTFAKFPAYYGDFRDSSPMWSQYTLYIPGVGSIPTDPLVANDPNGTLSLYMDFTPSTGMFTTELRNITQDGTYELIGHYTGCIGATIPYGIASGNATEVIGSASGGLAGTIANGAAQNYAGAAISFVGGLIDTVHTASTPPSSLIGATGSLSDAKHHHSYIMSRKMFGAAGIPLINVGRPLYQTRQINTLSGFIKCGGASLDCPAMGNEKDAINNFLNSGFYYE